MSPFQNNTIHFSKNGHQVDSDPKIQQIMEILFKWLSWGWLKKYVTSYSVWQVLSEAVGVKLNIIFQTASDNTLDNKKQIMAFKLQFWILTMIAESLSRNLHFIRYVKFFCLYFYYE